MRVVPAVASLLCESCCAGLKPHFSQSTREMGHPAVIEGTHYVGDVSEIKSLGHPPILVAGPITFLDVRSQPLDLRHNARPRR